jgi:hypothetical protein
MTTSAKIICDSVAPNGVRLTTFVCTFPRFILAEVNTHRDLSRNSASSRAIPSKVMLQKVKDNPFIPDYWGTNQPGMQADAELTGTALDAAKQEWQYSATHAADRVEFLNHIGLHKQIANRILEPFMWHTAIITTTKLDNFFWQRSHKDAQPEFKKLADAMQHAYYMGKPNPVKIDEWHLPFADDEATHDEVLKHLGWDKKYPADMSEWYDKITNIKIWLSMARCARVSYLQQDGTRAVEKDIDLYDKLLTGMHPSPSEHQGTPCNHVDAINEYNEGLDNLGESTLEVICNLSGNLSTGWHQHRKMIPNENRLHFIPNLPELAEQAEILKAGGKLW